MHSRGRGRGDGGRGNNQNQQNQGGGRGWDAPQRGSPHRPPAQQQWVNRPQVQGNQPSAQQAWSYRPQQTPPPQQPHQQGVGPSGGRPGASTGRPWGSSSPAPSTAQSLPPTQTPPQPSSGRGRGRGDGGRGNNQNQPNQGGGRGWDTLQRWSPRQPPAQQQWVNRPQFHPFRGISPRLSRRGATGRSRPHHPQQPHQQGVGPSGGGPGAWPGRPWESSPPAPSPAQSLPLTQTPPQSSSGELGMQRSKTSEKDSTLSSSSESKENQIQPIRRPDDGGTEKTEDIDLLVNHFHVEFPQEKSIYQYNFEVKPASDGNKIATLRKPQLRAIRSKFFSDHEDFHNIKSAYDGKNNIFSEAELTEGLFKMNISETEHVKSGEYAFEIKFVKELKLSKLQDYFSGNLSDIPRDILQGLDLVMKENPTEKRIVIGRGFYSNQRSEDLRYGVQAWRGFKQSLKPTKQGLALCLDYSVLAFLKPLKVIDFIKQHFNRQFINDVIHDQSLRRNVEMALKGLKVRVTHRAIKQKYIIASLAGNASDTFFDRHNPESNTSEKITIEKYFEERWGENIEHPNIPCLELGKNGKSNIVPMELCVLVEGQRFQPKEYLDKAIAQSLENSLIRSSAPWPRKRKNEITRMVKARDGPHGDVSQAFKIVVHTNMTKVQGRIIPAPQLKVGSPVPVVAPADTCQRNLLGRYLVDGKPVQRWVLLDFTGELNAKKFINGLKNQSERMGISMEDPLVRFPTVTEKDRSPSAIEDPIYKYIKWVSETRIGVVTQCCTVYYANAVGDQYLTDAEGDQYLAADLCLKINAKLGGSNFEVDIGLPHFIGQEHMMFIGADVNHPGLNNTTCPSIAAVVGTVNWPAANCYAARLSPQGNRNEMIVKFGAMCSDLINAYDGRNNVKPTKIVVFRDGVSDWQFGTVFNEELVDLKKAISEEHNYKPKITFVVAQKRHQTRLFVENGKERENVPPGTVVDTVIVHPVEFDFYLCSHHGSQGTSKPTHYYVLLDENSFTSDQLQQLIYHMCFTFARCTKPVSVVPPVYYADLLAYRGRMFQEAAMETQSAAANSSSSAAPSSSAAAASPSSSAAAASPSSSAATAAPSSSAATAAPSSSAATAAPPSTASLDPSIYTLHQNLENIMFFV